MENTVFTNAIGYILCHSYNFYRNHTLNVAEKDPDEEAHMDRLVWVFVVHTCPRTLLCWAKPTY